MDTPFNGSAPPGTRLFTDYDTTRKSVYDGVVKGLGELYPLENTRYRLELHNPTYTGPDAFTLQDEKKAILGRSTLSRRLKGTWRLINKENEQVVDEKPAVLGHVPYLTRRGTYIVGGNEYTVANQMRLRPGIYTRVKDNGEYEAHFNIFKGGKSFRVFMEPQTGVFRMQVGQSLLKLYPILKAMGVSDKQMQESWGQGVWAENRIEEEDRATLKKAYDRLNATRVKQEEGEEVDPTKADFAGMFSKLELDPEVTKRTLGIPHTAVTPAAMMDTTAKLLRISRKESDPDDRDSLAFQTVHSAEDFIRERIAKDAGRAAHRALWKATFWGNLSKLQPGALDSQIESLFYKSGMAQPLEEINPIDALDQNLRVTRMGEGGIPSDDAVPDECYDEATEVFTSSGWRRWSDVTEHDVFACLIDGRMDFRLPSRVIRKAYAGPMYGIRTRTLDILVTPGHRHWVQKVRGGGATVRLGKAPWDFELAKDMYRKPRQFLLRVPGWVGHDFGESYTMSSVTGARRLYRFALVDFAELLGWYVSEGSIDSYALRTRSKYQIAISQDRHANPEKVACISALLSRMGLSFSYQGHNFVFVSKQLGVYLAACGKDSQNKRLPSEVFSWPLIARQKLYTAMVAGDGSTRENGAVTYSTNSSQLRDDFTRLACGLGLPATPRKDDTRGDWVPRYSISVLSSETQGITDSRFYGNYYQVEYSGMVYCAMVPGEKLLVRRNGSVPTWSGNSRNVQPSHFMFIDPVRSPESGRVGVDSRATLNTFKGADGRFYTRAIDAATGKPVVVTPQDMVDSVVSFPGELAKAKREGRNQVKVMKGGRLTFADRREVQYEAPSAQELFTIGSNLVPMVSAIKGGRLLMGAKMAPQALPIRDAEAPLVQSAAPDGGSFEKMLGRFTEAAFADVPGTVVKVTDSEIVVKGLDGAPKVYELYNNFPMNRKTYLHSTPVVKVGDLVSKGQALARGNFTDKEGTLALGTNLRVGYMPFRGLNYEDAVVISQAAADKLTSEHMYTEKMDVVRGVKPDRNAFISVFPATYTKKQLDTVGDDGVVRPGTVVQRDDPLILAVERKGSPGMGMLSRSSGQRLRDASVTWEHDAPGLVTDVFSDDGGIKVAVKAYAPAQVGDKLSGRHGNKGVIGAVIPNDEMVRGADGKPLDILLNPLGVISRVNPAQLYEAVLGKIARRRGKPYVVQGFTREDMQDLVEAEMKKYGVSDTESVMDPKMQRNIPGVLVGEAFFHKLHHTAECFDEQTEVLTQQGWKFWKDVTLQDEIATSDTRGNTLFFERPLHLMSYDYDGLLCSYSGKYLDYSVTPNHNLWCKSYFGERTYGLRQASEMHGRRFRVKQFGLVPTCPGGPSQFHVEGAGYDWDDFCELVGWWVTEGTVETSKSAIVIYQSGTANPKKLRRIEALVTRMGLRWTPWKANGIQMGVRVACKALAAYFGQYGKHDTKRVPREVITGRLSGCRRAIESMMLGDGSDQMTSTGPSKRFISTSKFLVDAFQEMCVRVGVSSIVRRDSEDWVKYRENPHYKIAYTASYTVARLNSMVDGDRNEGAFEMRPYQGKVYCAEMRTGLLYVRRNGKPMLSGNSKESGRGLGSYSMEGEPAAGDEDNPKRVGTGELAALIAHGAVANIRDIKTIRGQRNDDYWSAVIQGYPPPTPGIPNMYKKFLSALQGAGINVKKEGNYLHLMAMTDRDVDTMSSGALSNADTVKWKSEYGREAFGEKSMDPVPGGLFDLKLTGGHGGNKWSHIQLSTPVPQPIMEDPIRRLLGLTQKAYEATIAGTNELPGFGTGTEGIRQALSRINVDQQIGAEIEAIKTATSASKRDACVKRLKDLKGIKDSGLNPVDLMVSKVPVLPPIFRPITATEKFDMVAGANLLYKDLMDADSNLKELSTTMQGEPVGAARLNVYNALKAVTGLGDPIKPERVQQKVHGLLEQVFGCYDDQTEFLTLQGWIPCPQYQGGVPVATLNPSSGAFEWQLPSEVHHYRYQGELVQLLSRNSIDLLVTPNHRNWVCRRGDNWKIEQAWVTASEHNRTRLYAAAAQWVGHRKCPEFVRCDVRRFARFVGWWVAEGYFHVDGGVELDQATRARTECEELDRLTQELGLPVSTGVYSPSVRGKGYSNRKHWSIKSGDLEQWLRDNVSSRSEGKVLSRFILDWDKDILIEFLLGYLLGDGERNGQIKGGGKTHRRVAFLGKFTRFSTTSERLFSNFQEIGLKLGVVVRQNKPQKPQKENHHQQYRGSLHGDIFAPYEGRIGSFVPYDGYVHCVTVPNGLVFVRRNGKPIVSGNSSPKMGLFQRKLLGSSVDTAGRAAITPNPSLDMDQVGIPEDQAWKLYAQFVTRNLVRRFGNKPEMRATAVRMVATKDPKAREALMEEMRTRPVLVTRAPALHRYSIMALYPVITKGHTMQLSPAVTPGFNADFDGDAMNFHVVISDEAIREAKEKMLPSRNLRSGADFSTMWGPRQEFLQGLYAATATQSKKPPRIFATRQDVIRAFREGQIDVDDPVVIAKP